MENASLMPGSSTTSRQPPGGEHSLSAVDAFLLYPEEIVIRINAQSCPHLNGIAQTLIDVAGSVVAVGPAVSELSKGMQCVSMQPLDNLCAVQTNESGNEFVKRSVHTTIELMSNVSPLAAAASITPGNTYLMSLTLLILRLLPGVRAITAIYYKCKVVATDICLVVGGGPTAVVMVQLLRHIGASVIVAVS